MNNPALLALALLLSTCSPALACTARDGLPDPACTPGATDPRVTQENVHETICVPGYAKSVRPHVAVTNWIKRERMAAYGIDAPMRVVELDHLISLELGGCPDCAANLWPELWDGAENAHDKDKVENRLHQLVCQGRLPLTEAQRRIASDWRHALDEPPTARTAP